MAMVLRAERHDEEQVSPAAITLLHDRLRARSAHPAWVAERERRRAHRAALTQQQRDAETVNRVWARIDLVGLHQA